MAYFQTVKIIMAYFHLTLIYSRHAPQMLKDNANEMEIRFIMSTDQTISYHVYS
jgi:hypothetical protein